MYLARIKLSAALLKTRLSTAKISIRRAQLLAARGESEGG